MSGIRTHSFSGDRQLIWLLGIKKAFLLDGISNIFLRNV
jgi:hypothetical protein